MLTVIETPEFIASADKVWSDGEREAFVDWIAENPEAGDVIPGSGGLRKVRWSRPGMGKRGGTRVIYPLRLPRGELALLLVYAKAKFDNLSPDFLKNRTYAGTPYRVGCISINLYPSWSKARFA